MNEITINNTIIELFIGDLVNTEYNAIVIPTNSRLLPSGPLRCRVLREAGSKVQVECNKIIQKISNIPVGNAIITSGGNLNSKHIIHARAGHDGKKLMLATWNSLKVADKNDVDSLVFPPLSKDVMGFNAKLSAKIMLSTIKKFALEKNNNIRNISICLDTLPDYKDFENYLTNVKS